MGPGRGVGVGHAEARTRTSSESILFSESLRMALVVTLHHKYIQLSSSEHTLPIHNRTGIVMTPVLKL